MGLNFLFYLLCVHACDKTVLVYLGRLRGSGYSVLSGAATKCWTEHGRMGKQNCE